MPYHPMGNRISERMNRTVNNLLKTLTDNHQVNWDDHIKKLKFAYNNSNKESTGYSSHSLFIW